MKKQVQLARVFFLGVVLWGLLFVTTATVVQQWVVLYRARQDFEDLTRYITVTLPALYASYGMPAQGGEDRFLGLLEGARFSPWFLGFEVFAAGGSDEVRLFVREGQRWRRGSPGELPPPGVDVVLSPASFSPEGLRFRFWFMFTSGHRRSMVLILGSLSALILFTLLSVSVAYLMLRTFVLKPFKGMISGLMALRKDPTYRFPSLPVREFDEMGQLVNRIWDELQQSQSDVENLWALTRQVFDLFEQPLLLVSQGQIVSLNEAARKLFGMSSLEKPRPLSELSAELTKVLEQGQRGLRTPRVERRVRLFEGSRRSYDIFIFYPREGALGDLVQIIDSTEAEQREDRLRQQQHVETLGLISAGLVHDLNNILSGLTGTTSILRHLIESRGWVDGETLKENIAILETCGERAMKLTRGLLHLSPRREFTKEPIKLREVVEQAVAMIRPMAKDKVEVALDVMPQDLTVLGDQARSEQILVNVLVNALHAMGLMLGRPQPEGRIVIHARRYRNRGVFGMAYGEAKQDSYVRVSVRDEGIGIPAEILPKVFNPFFTTKLREAGSGLGLTQVRSDMFLQGGWVDICSHPGKGTVVSLFFVSAESAPQEPPTPRRVLFWVRDTALIREWKDAYLQDEITLEGILDLTAIPPVGDEILLLDLELAQEHLASIPSWLEGQGHRPLGLVNSCPLSTLPRPPLDRLPMLTFPFFPEDLDELASPSG